MRQFFVVTSDRVDFPFGLQLREVDVVWVWLM